MTAAEILGIRHYSPACARLVRARIAELRPHTVLIEGPSDFNARLDELALPHTLPIAIYAYHGNEQGTSSCHAPFAEFAPEWAALQAARETGARVRFMDLPYWHEGARELPQRYTLNTLPGRERYSRVSALLQRRFGVDGEDALWDHLFEREADLIGTDEARTDALQAALDHYFDELRADEPGHPSDQAREAHMREWIEWACATPGPVLVVCGGWHRGALLAREVSEAGQGAGGRGWGFGLGLAPRHSGAPSSASSTPLDPSSPDYPLPCPLPLAPLQSPPESPA